MSAHLPSTSMYSMAKCPRCCFPYDFDTNRNLHPVSLACGHTYCRACLLNICKNNRTCPACRTIFNGDVGVMPLDWTFLGLYVPNIYAGDVVAMLRNFGKKKALTSVDTVSKTGVFKKLTAVFKRLTA